MTRTIADGHSHTIAPTLVQSGIDYNILHTGTVRSINDGDDIGMTGKLNNVGILGHDDYTGAWSVTGTVSGCGEYKGTTSTIEPSSCSMPSGGVIYYSQKTGDLSGDSDVWNTARNGAGSSADPGVNDWRIILSGHTITAIDHLGLGLVCVESGGVFDQGDYNLTWNGSLIVYGSRTIGTGKNIFTKGCRLIGI